MPVPPSVPSQILCRVDYVHESPVPGVHRHVHLNNVTKLWRSMNETLKPMGMEKTKVSYKLYGLYHIDYMIWTMKTLTMLLKLHDNIR